MPTNSSCFLSNLVIKFNGHRLLPHFNIYIVVLVILFILFERLKYGIFMWLFFTQWQAASLLLDLDYLKKRNGLYKISNFYKNA